MATRLTKRALLIRLTISCGAALLTLAAAEIALRIADRPKFPKAHTETRRFLLTDQQSNGMPIYVNYPGVITFTYSDNPRGYFNSSSEIAHEVNPDGFRGQPFTQKEEGILRLVFLGDSFTFGEGVKLQDTYPQITARYVNAAGIACEACNLGVGGYNTTQSETILALMSPDLKPDAVILGYTLNDAEPPLFSIDPMSSKPVRRSREALIESEGKPKPPPNSGIYRLRLAQLGWQAKHNRRLTKQTVSYYKSLFEPDKQGWQESQEALKRIIAKCKEKNIPCIVVMFPLLHNLTDSYPFSDIHAQVASVVKEAGGTFVDLLPELKGMDARKLWVHPTDQHPNERVHAIAGQKVADALRRNLRPES